MFVAHVITGRYKRRVKTGSKQGSVPDLWVATGAWPVRPLSKSKKLHDVKVRIHFLVTSSHVPGKSANEFGSGNDSDR